MTLPNEWITGIATKNKHAMERIVKLWRARYDSLDQQLSKIESSSSQLLVDSFLDTIKIDEAIQSLLDDQKKIIDVQEKMFNEQLKIIQNQEQLMEKLTQQAELIVAISQKKPLNESLKTLLNSSSFSHGSSLDNTGVPVLGYFDTGIPPYAFNQRRAITGKYTLMLNSSYETQIEAFIRQAQINTLIHPFYGNLLTGKPLYRDFVTQGGRLIVNLCNAIPRLFLNNSFEWALDWVDVYDNNERLNASGLTTTTPNTIQHTWCVAKSSLPPGAKVFLTAAANTEHVAGFYMRYGLGEVIGIGYDWYAGSNSAWDALLHGLIQGTALPYQRRYGQPK